MSIPGSQPADLPVGFRILLSPEADPSAYLNFIEGFTVSINGTDYKVDQVGAYSLVVRRYDDAKQEAVGDRIEMSFEDIKSIYMY